MTYYCVHAFDQPGRLEDRLRLREAHRARLRNHDHPVSVRVGGPLLDDAGAMIGTLLIIEAEDRAAVETYLSGDPYWLANLFELVTITRFNWGLGLQESQDG